MTEILIRRIMTLPCLGADRAEAFVGKRQDKQLADKMKNEYDLTKGTRGYLINLLPIDKVEPIKMKDIHTSFLLTPPPFQANSLKKSMISPPMNKI